MANKFKYSLNEFLSQTVGSHDKAVKLGSYHLYKIIAYLLEYPLDADYQKMHDRTLPLVEDAELKHSLVNVAQAAQEGQREFVLERLAGIQGENGKAHDWFDRTKTIYFRLNKPRFKEIWYRGLKPFRGKMDDIIAALKTLSTNIGDDSNAEMMVIKAEIDAEYLLLNLGRMEQKTDMATTDIKTANLEKACVALMRMEYRNSGLLMDKHPDNEDDIQESFHDMELLIGKQQSEWNLHPTAHQTIDVAKRAQLFNSKMEALVIGGAGKLYLARTPGGMDSNAVDLVDGIKRKFTAALFGITDYVAHRYITFVNQSGVVVSFKLKLG